MPALCKATCRSPGSTRTLAAIQPGRMLVPSDLTANRLLSTRRGFVKLLGLAAAAGSGLLAACSPSAPPAAPTSAPPAAANPTQAAAPTTAPAATVAAVAPKPPAAPAAAPTQFKEAPALA